MRQTLFVSLMMIICAAHAQIYKWTDSQGVVHFSDMPHQGAEQVNDVPAQSYSPPTPSVLPALENQASEHQANVYTHVGITQPVNQATIRNNQGYVVVTAKVEPELFAGDKVQIVFDGTPRGTPQTDLVFQLNGIYRGSHTIAVQIVDPKGEKVLKSPSITFFMQRPRVGMVKKTRPL